MRKVGSSLISWADSRPNATMRKNVRHIIAGTAGHIDHGKTALVRALTGIDTDRLLEEKRRGISIDLGFAHLDLNENLRLGLIDVPGHEKFVKNMLAGVGGIDLVLFIIAADESIKPQTREHFDICRLLQIPRGIVVLTKADLVDDELLSLVKMEAEEFLRGSFLESAPVIPVSSITGIGIGELKAELERMAETVSPRNSEAHFRMPIDRSFSMRGFGTVVTGTMTAGSVRIEDEVELHPSRRRVRVRGIQVHGAPAGQALAGQRTALNLTSIDASQCTRGMALASPGLFIPTTRIDCVFDLLATAKPLRHGAPVHLHAGTAEIEASVRLLEGPQSMQPGSRAYVRFILREPALLLPGDRFIVRMFSPVFTIGGGVVLDAKAPPKTSRAAAVERLQTLDDGTVEAKIGLFVRESPHGLGLAELVARTGFLEREIREAAASERFNAIAEPHFWLLDAHWAAARRQSLRNGVAAFHRHSPLLAGMPKEELRSRELVGAPAFLLDHLLAGIKDVAVENEIVRLISHQISFRADETDAIARMDRIFLDAGLAAPALREVLEKSGLEPIRARSILQILIREKKLIRISESAVYHSEALGRLRTQLTGLKGQRFTVPEFKALTGVSRKYAIPLLEFLDRERLTRRDGDTRIVL